MQNPYSRFSLRSLCGYRAFLPGCLLLVLFLSPPFLEGNSPPVILAFGDSLTAGFGVQEQESYPSRLQQILHANGYPHRVINGGVSGDTTAGGVRRIEWLLKHNPRVVIVALGANDGLRGLSVQEMYANLKKIAEICREHQARVLLAGMKIPPNYGETYSSEFATVYSRLAKELDVELLPFLLEGVAGNRKYTQPDGIHPLGNGYEIVANVVWRYLKPMLAENGSGDRK